MALSLKDRIKGLYRCFKILLNPKTNYVNLLWRTQEQEDDGDQKILTHTFYESGSSPVNPMLVYMARVAGKSETLEEVNQRSEYYLSRVCIAHMHHRPSETHVLRFMSNPIRSVEKQKLEASNNHSENSSIEQ